LLLITTTSCVEVLFEHPQPVKVKAEKQFPELMIGEYLDADDQKVSITPFAFRTPDMEHDSLAKMNKDFVLKRFKSYFVISLRNELELWQVAFITIEKNGDLSMKIIEANEREKIDILKKMVSVTTKYDDEDEYYIINPSKKELAKILKEDIFEVARLKKIK